jgi:hypothetical protein
VANIETDYAAPEVLAGQSYTGKEQDIWALGILLYTLIYRESPFFSVDEIIDRDLRVPYVLSEDSIDLIRAMLNRDVDKRFTIGQVLDHRWCKSSEDLIRDDELSAPQPSDMSRQDDAVDRSETQSRPLPTTLKEVLSFRDVDRLRIFVAAHFEAIVEEECPWLQELKDIGYTLEEMAGLLLENEMDAPWIFFEPQELPEISIQEDFHIDQCAHQNSSHQRHTSQFSMSSAPASVFDDISVHEGDIRQSVQELCGLAGIAPTLDRQQLDMMINFEDDNSTVIVSYATGNASDSVAQLTALEKALAGFCKAAGLLQAAGLICSSFTVLTRTSDNENRAKLWNIELGHAKQLSDEIGRLAGLEELSASEFSRLRPIIAAILQPLGQEFISRPSLEIHFSSLACQCLCLGILAYMQAHVGPLQLFFLDTPLQRVLLSGSSSQVGADRATCIEVMQVNLTCFAGVTHGPVLTFGVYAENSVASGCYDLLASAEDLLDTWGPGRLMYCNDGSNIPCAIAIGDGVIYETSPSSKVFHWGHPDGSQKMSPFSVDLSEKIIISALVTINGTCSIDEETCWWTSSPWLVPLGTSASYWAADERQFGIQGGQYVVGQFNQTWRKVQGRTLKDYYLEQDDDLLLSLLDLTWGLQVSFCTGIA